MDEKKFTQSNNFANGKIKTRRILFDRVKNFILKLQSLPEAEKKIVFFTIMAVPILAAGFFGFLFTKNNIAEIGQSVKSINLPKIDLQQDSNNFPIITDAVSGSNTKIINNILQDLDKEQAQNSETADLFAKALATEDWKIYTNEEYGFEIKYPKDWIRQKNIISLEYDMVFCSPEVSGGCNSESKEIHLLVYKKNPKPKSSSYYYLGLNQLDGKYYYLFNEYYKNESIFDDMIASFKFTE